MPSLGKVGNSVQTNREVAFEWQIRDFFSLSDRENTYCDSPAFSLAGSSWFLRLYTNGRTSYSSSGWVVIYLIREDWNSAITVHCTFGIKGTHGVEEKECKKGEFQIGQRGRGLSECWSRAELENRESTLVPNGVLTITCNVRMGTHIAVEVNEKLAKEVESLKEELYEKLHEQTRESSTELKKANEQLVQEVVSLKKRNEDLNEKFDEATSELKKASEQLMKEVESLKKQNVDLNEKIDEQTSELKKANEQLMKEVRSLKERDVDLKEKLDKHTLKSKSELRKEVESLKERDVDFTKN